MTETLIQLFARPPQPGKVKTRLVAHVGVESATAIYRHCLQHNLQLLEHSSFAHQVWLSEPCTDGYFNNAPVQYQQGKDLGERMHHALSYTLCNGYQKAILIGSDCLDLTPERLQQASTRLDHHDLVVIPALDGGYVLIGASRSIQSALFTNIDWGTELVMKQTLLSAMRLNLNIAVLDPLRDIDTAEDLQHYPELNQYLNN
jgi:hypothetical protein